MKLPLLNISIEKRFRLQELVKNSRQQGTFLPAYIQNAPIPNMWLIGFCIIFILFIILGHSWSLLYWFVISGPLLAYLIFRQLQCFLYWNKLGKDSVFFDNQYFISIQNKTLHFIPLTEYNYTDIVLAGNEKYYIIRFHFDSISLLQPCKSKYSKRTLQFQNLLQQYTTKLKQSTSQINYNTDIKHSFFDKIMFRKNALIFSLFIANVLWFALPSIIDKNDFNYAKGINTATSYRTYLSEIKNVKYRDEARNQIHKIYNRYITNYRNTLYNSSLGAEAFVETLEYLRDKNIYNVYLQFSSLSFLYDVYSDDHVYNVIPITQSFTEEKNASRETDVFKTIQASFGKIFPVDIFIITSTENNMIPKFEVYYVYKNNVESLYYRVEEANLPDNKKTWYYGIEVEWWFRIILPHSEDAIYEFSLKSVPANQFSSESFNPDAVYTNMAISAFNDFKDEFYKQFLKD